MTTSEHVLLTTPGEHGLSEHDVNAMVRNARLPSPVLDCSSMSDFSRAGSGPSPRVVGNIHELFSVRGGGGAMELHAQVEWTEEFLASLPRDKPVSIALGFTARMQTTDPKTGASIGTRLLEVTAENPPFIANMPELKL